MKKCIVCKRELLDENDICHSCSTFYKWKYGKKYFQWLEEMKRHAQLNLGGKT
ncbi:MAG: hypothetical protein WCI72_04520 [archaeon]